MPSLDQLSDQAFLPSVIHHRHVAVPEKATNRTAKRSEAIGSYINSAARITDLFKLGEGKVDSLSLCMIGHLNSEVRTPRKKSRVVCFGHRDLSPSFSLPPLPLHATPPPPPHPHRSVSPFLSPSRSLFPSLFSLPPPLAFSPPPTQQSPACVELFSLSLPPPPPTSLLPASNSLPSVSPSRFLSPPPPNSLLRRRRCPEGISIAQKLIVMPPWQCHNHVMLHGCNGFMLSLVGSGHFFFSSSQLLFAIRILRSRVADLSER